MKKIMVVVVLLLTVWLLGSKFFVGVVRWPTIWLMFFAGGMR